MRLNSDSNISLVSAESGEVVAELVRGVRDAVRSSRDAHGFVRVAVRTASLDPFNWLRAQPFARRVYWSARDETAGVAGVGIADTIQSPNGASLTSLRAALENRWGKPGGAEIRYLGGMRFDAEQLPSAEWSSFCSYEFVLPRIELWRTDEYCDVVCNLVMPRDADRLDTVLAAVRAIRFGETIATDLGAPVYRENVPDQVGWADKVEWSLNEFSRSRLAKVVLARKATLGFRDTVDPVALLSRLDAATPHCYHFLYAVDDRTAFLGASPERLFKREGANIWSEAVAGTRPRGATEGDDLKLRQELLLSEKEQREHVYVRQSIKETLSDLCSELHVDANASEMRLARGRHLVSRVEGVLSDDVDTVDLIAGLHPTPAVGGYPTADALEAISKLETFDRGWYAAPFGWIEQDRAEFAVAIRSGLVEDKTLSLYSGAGIVGGSTAESEWAEIEHKITDFISVLEVDRPVTQ